MQRKIRLLKLRKESLLLHVSNATSPRGISVSSCFWLTKHWNTWKRLIRLPNTLKSKSALWRDSVLCKLEISAFSSRWQNEKWISHTLKKLMQFVLLGKNGWGDGVGGISLFCSIEKPGFHFLFFYGKYLEWKICILGYFNLQWKEEHFMWFYI